MKAGFKYKLFNGYFEDPCLFLGIPWEKRALLFDIGDIRRLAPSEIFRVSDVFVTHPHMDHFIGFDTLLRLILRRDLPVNVYGPHNITGCIEGKLRGYAWNLIADYPTVINVFAYNGRTLSHSIFRAKNRFRKEKMGRADSDGVLLKNSGFTVRAVRLDHGIPCLAYSMEEEFHLNIDKDRLLKKGLPVGPWLTDFKRMLREGAGAGSVLKINGRAYQVADLTEIARITKGQKICYATDVGITKRNISGLIDLAQDSDIFFCEAYFLEKDRERATERFHLTAKTCGTIAKMAGVKRLELMHFAPKYSDSPEEVIREATEAFSSLS